MSINPVIYIYFNGFYRKEFCRILKTLKSSGSELSLFLLVPILNFKAKLSKKTLKYTFVNVLFFAFFDTFFCTAANQIFVRQSRDTQNLFYRNLQRWHTATSNDGISQSATVQTIHTTAAHQYYFARPCKMHFCAFSPHSFIDWRQGHWTWQVLMISLSSDTK